MKLAYHSPVVLTHQTVEFGTVNISNNAFYQWCQLHPSSILCKIVYGPTNPGGGGCTCHPLNYLEGKDVIK